MKSSIFLAGCSAVLAAASPILRDRRLYFETDTVTTWVTVTMTEGDQPTIYRQLNQPHPTTTTTPAESSTTLLPPPPPPSSSSTVVSVEEVPTSTISPEPSPTTSAVVDSPKPVEPSPNPSPVSSEPAPAPAPSSTKEETVPQPSDYASTVVYHHNLHRSNHSAGALAWSDEHAGYAKTLAERCVFAHDTSIGGGGYGQNLAMWGSSGNPEALGSTESVARAITDGWYNDELELFPSSEYGKDNPDMSNFKKWGHFSQLVWKGTEKVGCYTNFCPPGTLSSYGSWYTVCNYYPAGNVVGAYAKNLLPPQGQAVVMAA
ncbi:hypothetical protein VTH06DRAFT_4928 [Thermothelomyces fergusii]